MIRSQQSSHSVRNALSALVLFAPLLVAHAGFAQEACGDTSCPKGFSCEMEPTACPAIDCVEGPCQPCVPSMVSVCRPGPCSADSDCADGMACADVEQTNCVGAEGACPEKPADASCTTTISKECRPRWALPCAADADCGAGFTCKEQEQCSCSGSSGGAAPGAASSPPSSGSGSSGSGSSGSAGAAGSAGSVPATPAPTPPDRVPESCTCEPTGTKACVAVQVACGADADCPSAWSCRDNPAGACWADSNGNTGCTPADPAKLCSPPFSDLVSGGGNGAVATDGAGLPITPKGDSGSGTPELQSATTETGGGCSIGAGRSGSVADLLALGLALGAALGLGRRRAQR